MANGDNNTGNPYSQQDVQRTEQVTSLARTLTEELKDQLGIRSRLNETEKAQLNLARQIQRSASENTIELGNQGSIGRQIIKDQKLLLKILNEKRTLEKNTSKPQQDRARAIFQTQSRIQEIQDELLEASGEEAKRLKGELNTQEGLLRGILKTADAETQRLALAYGMEDTTNTIIGQRKAEADIQKEINERMGVSGALVKGTGALMERLGMRSGIFNDAMRDSKEEMERMAEESTRLVEIADENGNITKTTLETHSKTAIMLAGMRKLAKGFGQALFDPFTLAAKLLTAFLDVNKAAVEFTRLTGASSVSLVSASTEASNLVDLLNTATELTKQTGLNAAAIFSPEQLGQLSDAKNLLGISAEQAGNLAMIMKLTGKSADQLGNAIYDNVDAGISQKIVYDDILSASDDIVASAGGNTQELGKAASAARKLGMDLQKVNQIANGLLDFESSISAELEAQLLTGKSINLAKARELALNNDLEGVAQELANNGASAAEFAKMNRIQQQALAQALGMSREELGKMVLNEEALAKMTAEQRAQARGVTLEQSKQMDIQTRLTKSISALSQAFAPILENFIIPVTEGISFIVRSVANLVGLLTGATKELSAMEAIIGTLVIAYGAIKTLALATQVIQGVTLGIEAARGGMAQRRKLLESQSLTKMIGQAIMGTITAFSKLGPAGIVLGLAAAAGVAALASKYTKADDMISPPGYGSRTLYGPEGAIQLNNKDTVIAGTNLFEGQSKEISPTTINTVEKTTSIDMSRVEAKLDKLISVISAGGNVYLDGNKVGSAQVLGTYKSS